VTLVPRLRLLFLRAESKSGDEAREAEREFHAAASSELGQEELEPLLARIRKRKQGLGQMLFVPCVLRAVVAYNVAIANRIDEDLQQTKQESDQELSGLAAFVGDDDDVELPLDAQKLEAVAGPRRKAQEVGSVFESAVIGAIAKAIRLRIEGSTPGTTTHERIASRVDLADLSDVERSYLSFVETKGRERALGLTVVVGLLIRTAAESALDFRQIGISPERLREVWALELDRALQGLVNDRLVKKDGYEEACALSDLQTRFLQASVSSVANRLLETRAPTPPSTAGVHNAPRRPRAKKTRAPAAEKAALASGRVWPWRQLGRAGAAVLGVLVALALANTVLWDAGSLGSDELERVSPFLSSGVRSGPAYVGAINDDWLELDPDEQMRAAAVLVQELRERSVRQIMIYDDDDRLRIQALGDRPPRVVPAIGD
jgi:hypothetical protein